MPADKLFPITINRLSIYFWTFFTNFIITISAIEESNLKFIDDFVSQHSSLTYNVIVCKKYDELNIVKIISQKNHKFVSVRSTEKPLVSIIDEHQTFIMDLNCLQSKTILEQAEKLQFFRKPFEWILLAFNRTGTDLIVPDSSRNISSTDNNKIWYWTFLETLSLFTDSEVLVMEGNYDSKITVTAGYKIAKDWALIRESLAEWTQRRGLNIINPKVAAIRREDLRGLVIRSSMVLINPDSLFHLEDMKDRHIDTTFKVAYNMMKILEAGLNVSFDYVIESTYGMAYNGVYIGMVGYIYRKEMEIGGSPIFLSKDRLFFLEYFAMVTPSRTKFIFMSPPLSHSRNIFLLPFSKMVWYCCIVLMVVCCSFLYVALRVEKSETKPTDVSTFMSRRKPREDDVSFTEILVVNIGALCLQGTSATSKEPPGRIVSLFLYITYAFMYMAYSASIVAILQSSDTSIQSLSDLLHSSLQLAADNQSYSQFYFKITRGPVRTRIYETRISPKGKPPNFFGLEEGIRKVRKGLFAFHVETSRGYDEIQKTFTEPEKCGVQESEISFYQTAYPWMVMKRHTPYAELFKIGMKRAIEKGFLNLFVKRYYTRKPTCGSNVARFISVGLADCYYAFFFLLCGVGIALIIGIIEVITKYALERQQKRRAFMSAHCTPTFDFIN